MTPEGRVKAKTKKMLNTYGAYAHFPVQSGMGAPCLDIHCCYRGYYLAIETKSAGKKPTERQKRTISEIEAAGGKCLVIDGDLTDLKEWLEYVDSTLGTRDPSAD